MSKRTKISFWFAYSNLAVSSGYWVLFCRFRLPFPLPKKVLFLVPLGFHIYIFEFCFIYNLFLYKKQFGLQMSFQLVQSTIKYFLQYLLSLINVLVNMLSTIIYFIVYKHWCLLGSDYTGCQLADFLISIAL